MLRRALALLRPSTARVARVASRFSAVTRYAFDLVVWSRIVARPTDLARHSQAMRHRGVEHPAPTIFITGNHEQAHVWEAGFSEIYRLLLANLQAPDLISRRRYGRPSPAFQGVYLWDSAFIAQVWKPWDVGVALDTCLAVVEQADEHGRLPHVITHLIESTWTQPPLLAWSLWRLHAWEGSERTRAALRAAWPRLTAFNAWLNAHRRLDDGLYFWAHPYESGVENAPRFSSRDERVLADTTRLAAPDLCSYVVLQCEALSRIAAELDDEASSRHYAAQAAALRERIDARLWHEGDGLYYDLDVRSGEPVRSATIASLMPLWAGVPDEARAARVLQRIMDPAHFGTLIPLPSVARSDPDFAKDMWRGATWINTAYGVLLGIERYGFRQQAAELAWRLVEGVYRTHANTHRVFEFYDPERFDIDELHRKRGNRWKHFTLGAKPRGEFVGWSGLVNTLVIEHLLGFSRDRGRAYLQPNLPPAMQARALAVRLPSLGLVVEVERRGAERYRGRIYGPDGVRRFETRGRERLYLAGMPVEESA